MSHPKIPLGLYIHIPWCVKKCPYCDFNSHPQRGVLPEKSYIDRLIVDLQTQLNDVQNRPIHSIFIGGGTPSLFAPESYAQLFLQLRKYLDIPNNIEITLEANPGTLAPNRFSGYRDAGINRLSIGVQSFQNKKLKALGRIHESEQARNAIIEARTAGFDNINIDLMFGLPNQTIDDAQHDLQTVIDFKSTHLSWYQLTLEPNTYFYRFPPKLPSDDARFKIQQAGEKLLRDNDYTQYEVSAYCLSQKGVRTQCETPVSNQRCVHNVNYWEFGDYLGIGAGAHAKSTNLKTMQVMRRVNTKHPTQYFSEIKAEYKSIEKNELPLEFMMNALRLYQPISIELFEQRTGLSFNTIQKPIQQAVSAGFLYRMNDVLCTTLQGRLFLNELLMLFL